MIVLRNYYYVVQIHNQLVRLIIAHKTLLEVWDNVQTKFSWDTQVVLPHCSLGT